MMGTKSRSFTPLGERSLEELVPADSLYRRLARVLDLSFVHDLVADCYAADGRPSVDPVVFSKLQLVMCLAGIHSERQLMRVVADRLSPRWHLGDDPDEPTRAASLAYYRISAARRGSNARRKPSAAKFSPIKSRASMMPGPMPYHGALPR